ncbi:glycosyltransferase family 2 protein [candidate division KSB1 bacterium]|nr:glycosyltransferase family 2 protein [candidate division KSB1 bacterium]
MEDEHPQLSIVVPLYNEERCVKELYDRLTNALLKTGRSYEIIFIDDGSQDSTYTKIMDIYKRNDHLQIIRLRRNFGQSAALAAGFDHASGEIIISMDGDLQHFPEEIPKFIAKIEEGYDIVSGWREKRVDNFILRRFPSMIANKLMAKLSGIDLRDFGTTFKAYRASVIKNIHLYQGLHRFIPALAVPMGVKIAEIPIENINRQQGKSNYGIYRTIQVLFDLLTVKFVISYMTRPMQFFGKIGALFGISGFLLCLLVSYQWFFQEISIQHNIGILILGVLGIIVAVQLLAIGLISETNSRIYHEGPNHRIYHVASINSRRVPYEPTYN